MPDNKEDFKSAISEAVQELMATQETSKRLEKAEGVLAVAEETVGRLSDDLALNEEKLATASTENTALKEQVEEIEARIVELTEALAAAERKAEETDERASAAETELANIAAERRVEVRVRSLVEAKVAAVESKLEAQKATVREMGDEEFASYLADRVELRTQTLAETADVTSTEDTDTTETETVEVSAPDVEGAHQEAAALLDIELIPEDTSTKMNELGDALAKKLVESLEK